MSEPFIETMSERCRQSAEKIVAQMKDAHDGGYLGAIVHGEADWLVRELASMCHDIESKVVCSEIGSAATLRRLQSYLGLSLPSNWETIRTNAICEPSRKVPDA